jgi:hypothetical protein
MARPPGNNQMNRAKLCVGLFLLFLLGACAGHDNRAGSVTLDQDIRAILSEADVAYKAAKAKNHSWTMTARLLASAREALSAGNETTALVDAERALLTAQASLQQANKEENEWLTRVPK